jgi:hypothetical protein
LGKKFKIPARKVYEGHEGDESVKNEKDVLKKDETTKVTEKSLEH